MAQGVSFWKYSATGNDFIIFNEKDLDIELSTDQIISMCKRREGIGADGVLILGMSQKYDFKMNIYNADGSTASMCGNGARALVHYAHYMLKIKHTPSYSFETPNGVYHANVDENKISLEMTEKYDEAVVDLPSLDLAQNSFYINTGVPHAVYHVDDVENFDVTKWGKEIRHSVKHNDGCNVNFFSIIDKAAKYFRLRTYERGVEDETLCCGTGAAATAIGIMKQFDLEGEFKFAVKGGEVTVSVDPETEMVIFTGIVNPIYRGELF